jgi:hypothetical protein
MKAVSHRCRDAFEHHFVRQLKRVDDLEEGRDILETGHPDLPPEALATELTPEAVKGRPVRLMFQDEARFGRMVRPQRCWAPVPLRPVICNGYEREFVYVYGAVSPLTGELDWRVGREMNTARMAEFLAQVGQAHPGDFIVMVLDGASSHQAKDLAIPDNIRWVPLPPYAPELNPQEHVWDELREKEFPNRVLTTSTRSFDNCSRACHASQRTRSACEVLRPGPGLLVST